MRNGGGFETAALAISHFVFLLGLTFEGLTRQEQRGMMVRN